jgi:hypothetical protein
MQRDVPILRTQKQRAARRKRHVIGAVFCAATALGMLVLLSLAPGPSVTPLAADCVEFVQTRKSALDGCAL